MREATHCIGSKGMIGGQAIDLSQYAVFKNDDIETLMCRNMKTAALLQLTLSAGAIVCGAAERDIAVLKRYGRALGFAYQICDDVFDKVCASEQTGKPARQDSRHFRISILDHLDGEAALRLALDLTENEKKNLQEQLGDRPAVQLLFDAAAVILQDCNQLAKKIA